MHLYDLPLLCVLVGLILYTVLGGADFGAGFWMLFSGRGPSGERAREHAHASLGPVWEANHVWLIFVLTVTWTAYPSFFGSIASTLSIPFFIAAIGIILRGAAYAMRTASASPRERHAIDSVLALSSILTPFALGTIVGAIASGRVPVGNAAGDLVTSWTGPLSLVIGALAVASSAYLAAVFLAADAARVRDRQLQEDFRERALVSGLAAGAIAIVGLVVLHQDDHGLYVKLVHGAALAGPVVSIVAGMCTLELVRRSRFEIARYSAAVAVAAIIGGWALAQRPVLLPGLTVQQAAAPHDALVALLVSILIGGLLLFPSLAVLFRLFLGGRLGHPDDLAAEEPPGQTPSVAGIVSASAPGLLGRVAVACLVACFGFLTIAESGWAHAIGVAALLAFVATGVLALVPMLLAQTARGEDPAARRKP